MAKTCNGCGNEGAEMTKVTMSSADWQRSEQRHEKREKRLWIALIVAVAMLFVSNMGWLIYQSQFETFSYDYTQDGNGNNIIGNDNEVDYNGAEIEDTDTQEEKQ